MSRKSARHLRKINLPDYSKREETANMITHTVGGAFALVSLFMCIIRAAWHNNTVSLICAFIYGLSMILVYSISSVYHGLDAGKSFFSKVVLRVVDHCDIYYLIIGSFAPVAMTGLRKANPRLAWISFAIVCATAVIGSIFTAIDFKKYRVISYSSYFIAGWSVVMTLKTLATVYPPVFIILLVIGGAVYTSGMIFFVMERHGYQYAHSIFHVFILAGSIIQFIPIFWFCM